MYAIHHPEPLNGLIIRDIWLANKYRLEHYMNGGIKEFFPEVWERFAKLVPEGKKTVDYYLEKMLSDDQKISDKYAYEWAYYEMSFYTINKIADSTELLKALSYKSIAIIEAHYIKNNCFLSEDFIMKNIYKIKNIKTSIVHGRYDFICPPGTSIQIAFRFK